MVAGDRLLNRSSLKRARVGEREGDLEKGLVRWISRGSGSKIEGSIVGISSTEKESDYRLRRSVVSTAVIISVRGLLHVLEVEGCVVLFGAFMALGRSFCATVSILRIGKSGLDLLDVFAMNDIREMPQQKSKEYMCVYIHNGGWVMA